MPNIDQDRATSYHEAAHAVFTLKVCSGVVRYVEVDEGYCATGLPGFDGRADNWRRALYTLAGSFAEQLGVWGEIRPEEVEEVLEAAELEAGDGDEGDRFNLVALLGRIGANSFEGLRDEYETVVRDTESEVRRLWSDIEMVAAALKERRCLEAHELEELLEGGDNA